MDQTINESIIIKKTIENVYLKERDLENPVEYLDLRKVSLFDRLGRIIESSVGFENILDKTGIHKIRFVYNIEGRIEYEEHIRDKYINELNEHQRGDKEVSYDVYVYSKENNDYMILHGVEDKKYTFLSNNRSKVVCDKSGNIIKISRNDEYLGESIELFTYNEMNQKIEFEYKSEDETYKYKYYYNSSGLLVRDEEFGNDGNIIESNYEYEFDANGNWITQRNISLNETYITKRIIEYY